MIHCRNASKIVCRVVVSSMIEMIEYWTLQGLTQWWLACIMAVKTLVYVRVGVYCDRICGPSLAPPTYQIPDRSDWSYRVFRKELSSFISALVACLIPILCSSLDSRASQDAEKTGLQVSLTLWKKRDRAYITYSLLPHDSALLSRLRATSKFPRIPDRTINYQPFISYALSKYPTN